MKKILLALILCFTMTAFAADTCTPKRTPTGRIARSTTQVAHFKKANACPATGKIQKSCPGYVVDHVIALCKCGPDNPTNMQWQTVKESKIKDKTECK